MPGASRSVGLVAVGLGDEQRAEPDLLHEVSRQTEVLLALPGVAHDEVGREVDPLHGLSGAPDDREEIGPRVAAVHRRKDPIAPRLARKVEVLAHVLVARDRVDHGLGEVLRVRAREADSGDPGPCDPLEEPREVAVLEALLPVRIDVLAKEKHLPCTRRSHQRLHFREDRLRRPASQGAAGAWHDAVRARVGAPLGDRDHGRHGAQPPVGDLLAFCGVREVGRATLPLLPPRRRGRGGRRGRSSRTGSRSWRTA